MRSNNRPRVLSTSFLIPPKYKVRMSNAKSRLRLIEPVRMFDEQRVNTARNCQCIRGYCLHSSGRPCIQEESKEESKEENQREREREREREKRKREVVQRALG